MKKKSLIGLGIAAVLTIGTIVTVSADTTDNYLGNGRNFTTRTNSNFRRNADTSCPGYDVVTRAKGYEIINSILVDKYNLTEDYIEGAFNDGKTLGEILDENNIDINEFKKEFSTIRLAEIDEAVKNGDITKEEGETIKENFLSNENNMNFENHIGNGFKGRSNGMGNGNGSGKGTGRGNGNNGRGQGRGGYCN